jgi:hypothetical protein
MSDPFLDMAVEADGGTVKSTTAPVATSDDFLSMAGEADGPSASDDDPNLITHFGVGANKYIADTLEAASPGGLLTMGGTAAKALGLEDVGETMEGWGKNAIDIMRKYHPAYRYIFNAARKTDPKTSLERHFQNAGGFTAESFPAAAMPFGKAATGLASTALQTAEKSGPAWRQTLNEVGRNIVRQVQTSPGKLAAGEAVATLGSAAGGEIAEEFAGKEYKALGQIGGGTATGAIPAAARGLWTATDYFPSAKFVKKGIQSGRNALRVSRGKDPIPLAETGRGKKVVKKELTRDLTDKALAQLDESQNIQQEINKAGGNFRATLDESMDSVSLRREREAQLARKSGKDLELEDARRAGNEAAVQQYRAEQTPAGPEPEIVVDAAKNRVADLRAGNAARVAKVDDAQTALAGKAPKADKYAIGGALRGKFNDLRTETRKRLQSFAAKNGLNDTDITIQFKTERSKWMNELTPDLDATRNKDVAEVLSDLQRVGAPIEREAPTGLGRKYNFGKIGGNKPVTLGEIVKLRSNISDDLMGEIAATNGSRAKIRSLVQVKKRLDGFLDELEVPGNENFNSNYKAFRQMWRDEYEVPFNKGTAYKVNKKTSRGDYQMTDERVADAFFKAGDVSGAKAYKAAFADDKEASESFAAAALDSLHMAAVKDGKINQTLFNDWIKRHGSVLDEFPALKQTVENIGSANKMLASRSAELVERSRKIEGSLLVDSLKQQYK